MTEEYERYLKDQRDDTMFEERHLEMGKNWMYQYMDICVKHVDSIDFSKANILDVGCREFFSYDYFKEKYNNVIKGIDIGEIGLKYTEKEGKSVINADAHKLLDTFSPESFDVIMAVHSLEHMFDIKKVVENCHKALKKDGFLYLAVPIPCHNTGRGHWVDIDDKEFVLDLLKDVGYTCRYVQSFGRGQPVRKEDETIGLFQKC